MAFKDTYRLEKVYYENMWTLLRSLKALKENPSADEITKVNEILDDTIACNESIIIIYKNLGELYAEVAQKFTDLLADLVALRDEMETWKDEINEKIDEVNNYLMALIRDLEQRMEAVEADLATMNRNKFYDLVEDNGSYLIEKDGETVSFDDIKADVDFPHNVILRYDNGVSETELEVRESTDSRIDFYSSGLSDLNTTVKEILVSIDDTEAVTYSENTLVNPLYTFGTGLSLDSDNELSVDFNTVQAKLTEGTGIDINSNNEISVDTSVIQEKLTEGTGIDIDSNNNISVDTTVIQEKLTEGNGIDIDSNNEISVDTSVVQPKLTEGFGIDIDSNNEIKVDTAQVQEKLIAGQNITLTPDSTDPTKTVIEATGGSSYTGGHGISIDSSNVISATDEALFLSSVGTLQSVSLNTSDIATLMQTSSNSYEIGNDNKYFRDGSGGGGDSVSFSGKKRVRITATMLTDKEYTSAMASALPFVDKQEADFEVSARISILQGSDTYWCENLTVHGEIVSHHNTALNKDYVYFRAFEERTALIELDPTKTYKIHVYFYWYMKGDIFLHNTIIQGRFGNLPNLFGIETYS